MASRYRLEDVSTTAWPRVGLGEAAAKELRSPIARRQHLWLSRGPRSIRGEYNRFLYGIGVVDEFEIVEVEYGVVRVQWSNNL